MANRLLALSDHVYGVLLRLYPRRYRDAYGLLMRQTFRDACRDAYRRGGARRLAQCWLHTCGDTASSLAVEHLESIRTEKNMTRRALVALIAVLIFSVITGYINLNNNEVQPPLLCLLVFSFIAGLLQPKGAWRWALIIGLSIPTSYFIGFAIRYQVVDPPRYPITLVVLVIPALVAVYTGVLLRRGLARPQDSTPA